MKQTVEGQCGVVGGPLKLYNLKKLSWEDAMAKMRKVVKAGLATGLGLAAAAAAGAYFVYGKTAKHRRALRGWMLRMKGEVLERIESMKEVNEDTYKETVDKVAKRYRKVKDINQKELEGLVKDLRGAWGKFQGKIKAVAPTQSDDGHE
jgi:hypothetical protein